MIAPPEVRAERLSPAELAERLAAVSVVYVPLGALEFHGPHLPIGLDALTAHGICVAAAVGSGGVVLPPVHHAIGGEHGGYPWTLMLDSPSTLAETLLATIRGLERVGVRRVVLLSGHFAPEQRALLDSVVEGRRAGGAAETEVVAATIDQCDSLPLPPDHAGAFETLLLQALEPGLVHLDRLPEADSSRAADPDPFGPQRHEPSHPLWGVFGPDPRVADPRLAPDVLSALARWAARLGCEGR